MRHAVEGGARRASVQRSRVHFLRNVLAQVPRALAEMVAATARSSPNSGRVGPRATRPDRAPVPDRRDDAAGRRARTARVHRVPGPALEEDLVHGPATGATCPRAPWLPRTASKTSKTSNTSKETRTTRTHHDIVITHADCHSATICTTPRDMTFGQDSHLEKWGVRAEVGSMAAVRTPRLIACCDQRVRL
jgi:hypothetical protein